MGYRIELTGSTGPGASRTPDGQAAGPHESLAEAVARAEQLAAQAGQGEAVVYREQDTLPGSEVARFSPGGGWSSEAITPASWWARLSLPTKEKLKAHPRADLPREVWDEIAEAGGAVLGVRRPGPEAGSEGLRLPADLAGFIESEQPKL